MRVLISGNSNSGKTTLFNALTGLNAHTGNWHGVTVNSLSHKVIINQKTVEFIDLPGLFSLSDYSLEEKHSSEILKKGNYDIIINVIEASSLKQAMHLTNELLNLKKPMIIFINFYNELIKNGGKLDTDAFKKSFGGNVVCGEANEKSCVNKLIEALFDKRSFGVLEKFKIDDKIFRLAKFQLSKADKILLNGKIALPIYAIIIALTFYMAFGDYGFGSLVSGFIAYCTEFLKLSIDLLLTRLNVNRFITELITEGVLGGIGSVLVFLPQVAVLQICLITLEQSGLIARISFLTDSFLAKIGLSGRAIFSLLMGFGCTAIAINTTNGVENLGMKRRLCRALPFITCSARTPTFIFFAEIAFRSYTWLVLLTVYFSSVIITILFLLVEKRITNEKIQPLVLEVPNLRKINRKNTIKPLKKNIKEFIMKLGTVVMLVSVSVYLLRSFSPDFKYLSENEIDKSILAFLGQKTSFIFAPIGLDDWKISTAFISGIFAKEAIVSTLYLTNPIGLILTQRQTIAIITFSLIYTPCIVALDSIRVERGLKTAFKVAVFQLAIALISCYLIFYVLSSKLLSFTALAAILIGTVILILPTKGKKNEGIYIKNSRKTF